MGTRGAGVSTVRLNLEANCGHFTPGQRVCYNAVNRLDGFDPSGNKCQGGATMAESDFTVYYDFR